MAELRIGIPENDVNRDDKIDICDLSQQIMGGDPIFLDLLKIRSKLAHFQQIVKHQGSDAFLLEALFRNNAWNCSNPSQANECV